MKLNFFKNWRIYLLVLIVLGSIFLILPSPQPGVLVKSISKESPFQGKVFSGDIISWANEKTIEQPSDLYAFDDFTGVFRFTKNDELTLVDIAEPGLGIVVEERPSTKINLGLDLIGGTRVILKPIEDNVTEDVMNQIISTLETRINIYGLRESRFQIVNDISGDSYVQIEMAGGSQKEIEELLAKQGRFEGKIPKLVPIEDGKGTLNLDGKDYAVTYSDQKLTLGGRSLSMNSSATLDDLDYAFVNYTNNTAVLLFTAFTSDDIRSVCIQDQPGICTSRLYEGTGGYQFMFQVIISQEGAERFAKITRDMNTLVNPNSGEVYLESKLALFLDENLITELSISGDLAGKALTEPMITGGRENKEDAKQEKLRLQSILQSGELPAELEIIRSDQVSATLGQEFISSAILAGVIAGLMVGVIVFIRYRKIMISVPVIITSFSEVIIILGISTLIGWTIDLAAIAGIVAAVGTGVDSQIMILDELVRKGQRVHTLKQRIKRAFFLIFGAASTTIAAMLPMIFIGIGVMRGFAIVTTLGVLIGIFITRPAFSVIAERIIEKEELKSE